MRHFPRLNKVAYGLLERWRPRVLNLLKQNCGLPARSRKPCAASHLLRVRLRQSALCLTDCASDADFRLR
jgi:hypothetical protein